MKTTLNLNQKEALEYFEHLSSKVFMVSKKLMGLNLIPLEYCEAEFDKESIIIQIDKSIKHIYKQHCL